MSGTQPKPAGAEWRLDSNALEQAKRNFRQMDVDKDGRLSESEFRSGLGMLGMDESFAAILFAAFDKGGDGYIDMREFLAAMGVMLHPNDVKQQVSLAFDAYDLNKDGKLQLDELKAVIKSIFSAMYSMGLQGAAFGYTEESAERTAEDLFALLDPSKQGFVTKDDYEALATTHPELIKQIGLGGGGGHQRSKRTSRVIGRNKRFSGLVPRARKSGTTVSFGHEHWELVVQMMLGIRISLARVADAEEEQPLGAEVSPEALLATCTFSVPTHRKGRTQLIRFKDYAPRVFLRIRALFGVSEAEYKLSLGPEQILGELLLGSMGSLSELFSEGKSGAFFYYSNDGLYLIKTIPHREALSLGRMLLRYLAHVRANPHTLLPRYYGFHRLQLPNAGKVHFVVMANVFSTERRIHERYDLKGSYLGRTVGAANADDTDVVRKDLDLKRQFYIGGTRRDALIEQMRRDLAFLREAGTMDYSLLCGVHYPRREEEERENDSAHDAEGDERGSCGVDGAAADGGGGGGGGAGGVGAGGVGAAGCGGSVGALAVAGAARPRPPWVDSADGAIDAHRPVVGGEPERYFLGIIDILTAWSPAKLGESVLKQATHPTQRDGVSCVPPHHYAERFERAFCDEWIA